MNRLNATFGTEIAFFYLNIDSPETAAVMPQLLVNTRSTYILLAADGREIARWFGPLDEMAVNQVMADLVESP